MRCRDGRSGGPRRRAEGERAIVSHMRRLVPIVLVVLAFFLHQDFWYWRTPTPLFLGVLPPGHWYHAIHALACSC